jgi:hypothetical protein
LNEGAIMSEIMSRRAILRKLGSAAALLVGIAASSRGKEGAAANEIALNNCFWRKEATVCSGGVLKEKWCHICCYGLECETEWCEWRVVGTC